MLGRKAPYSGAGKGARLAAAAARKALNGLSRCYKRDGASTMLAAPEVAAGQVRVARRSRRRRRQFLKFMNDVVAQHPGAELHVILENLNTQKLKYDRWLQQHPRVHFHFIPTYS
ncbi:MAG: transposase [Bryobacterales bacterium]|nr:transposase [Bryobacterales bacterium]